MSDSAADSLTTDAFLGGKIHVLQPRKGFRSGIDAVLLAAAVPATTGDSVLELGCGVGVASLCLGARVPSLRLTGIEVQPDYAALAAENAVSNDIPLTVFCADLRALPPALRKTQFNHVMMNPPYFDRAMGPPARDPGRDMALAGDTPLADWLDVGIKRLAPKGTLTLIQHISRLPEVLAATQGRIGSVVLRPIVGRPKALPNLFLLQGRHSGRALFSLQNPLILHDGDSHAGDAESYTAQIQDVLRNGAALPIAD